MAGDARDAQAYAQLLRGETAGMAFLDPPYNVKIDGHAGGRGRIKHREFAFASGEMSSNQFVRFLKDTLGTCARTRLTAASRTSAWTGGMRANCLRPALPCTTS